MNKITLIRERGLKDVTYFMLYYLSARFKSLKKVNKSENYRKYFKGKSGLEIGGPSKVFTSSGQLPIYDVMARLDNINYSDDTAWTGKINSDKEYRAGKSTHGKQFILDAMDLSKLKPKSYDFVISSNNLEHLANPLEVIKQAKRLVVSGGVILVVAPKKQSNFDHRRKIVDFEHLVRDYKAKTKEDDLTHLEEILECHDLRFDLAAGSRDNFIKRSKKNIKFRCLHHHVFDEKVLRKIYRFSGLSVIMTAQTNNDYIILGKTTKARKI